MRVRTGVTGLAAAACAGVLLAPTPAGAAPVPTPEAAGSKTGSYCVVKVSEGKTTCYDTFREYMAVLSGGRITDAPAPEKAATDKKFQARMNKTLNGPVTTMGEYTGAQLYEHGHFGGRAIGYALSEPCKNDGKWDAEMTNLDDMNFDDMTSSVQTWNNCYIVLYSSANFKGISNTYDWADWVGEAMNDQATSFRLKARGEAIR
ncbi:hypothetical protein [Streptomyces sp. ML-6]|uniref:hypothetical protein n=1 Tax=Streptomyces sp. ML-6 TaxID=2982693 RepID=UPI0024C08DEA|nr:hypothetical protein [Streptomyces sp. ML-6]MDK0520659.1 beta/gamma crystallin family protein [Streptomyces sp. ML-6]